MVIESYLSDYYFNIMGGDCSFLVEKVKKSGHEYDFQLRKDKFNLYYKGNSLGTISYFRNKRK